MTSRLGPHPFYVQGENAFVNAADLKLGDDFRLADGRSAELVEIEIERAALGRMDSGLGSTLDSMLIRSLGRRTVTTWRTVQSSRRLRRFLHGHRCDALTPDSRGLLRLGHRLGHLQLIALFRLADA